VFSVFHKSFLQHFTGKITFWIFNKLLYFVLDRNGLRSKEMCLRPEVLLYKGSWVLTRSRCSAHCLQSFILLLIIVSLEMELIIIFSPL